MKSVDPPAPGKSIVVDQTAIGANSSSSMPPIQGIPLYDDNQNPATKRFVVNGYQDAWAAIVFIATIFMTIIWGIVNFSSDGQSSSNTVFSSSSNSTSTIDSISAGTMVGVVFLMVVIGVVTALSLTLLTRFSMQAILYANIGAAVLNVIAAIISFATGVVAAGVILIICAVLQLVWLYAVRARIPFSALLLKHATQLLQKYKAMIFVNFALIGVFLVYFIFWASMIYPYLNRSLEQDDPSASDGGLSTLFFFMAMWSTQVVFNVMHVTAAGLAATWYFVGSSAMPRNPTAASLKRAVTTSFGSICFGSLLVAIVKLLHAIAESNRRNSEHPFLACIMECLISVLERLLEYFNTYAFVHIAIYGCGYTEAAHRTWALAKSCAFAAVFNDTLVSTTCTVVAIGVSAIVAVIVGVATDNLAAGVVMFILVYFVHAVVFRAIESFVVTIFVCFAEQPQTLQSTSPDLYALIAAADQQV